MNHKQILNKRPEFSLQKRAEVIHQIESSLKTIEQLLRHANALDISANRFLSSLPENTLIYERMKATVAKWQSTALIKIRMEAERIRKFHSIYPSDWITKVRVVKSLEPLHSKWRIQISELERRIKHSKKAKKQEKLHRQAMDLIENAKVHTDGTVDKKWFDQWIGQIGRLLPDSTIKKLTFFVDAMEKELQSARDSIKQTKTFRSRIENTERTEKMVLIYNKLTSNGMIGYQAFEEIAKQFNDKAVNVKARISNFKRKKKKVTLQ